MLRSSGVRRTYWLVSIVLPWKSQRGIELEPTPMGRKMGTDRCVRGHARTGPARGRKAQRCSAEEKGHNPSLNPVLPHRLASPMPAPGLTLVGFNERMLPLEMFTVAVSYIRSHRPQQQKNIYKCSGARAGARKPRPSWAPPAPAPAPKPTLCRHSLLSATSALGFPPSGCPI